MSFSSPSARISALCVLSLLPLACAAHAAAPPATSAPDKPAGVVRPIYGPDGAFLFCYGDHTYDSGRAFALAETAEGALDLHVKIPRGGFEPGKRYDIQLTLGVAPARRIRAEALTHEMLRLPLGPGAEARTSLGAARTFEIGAGKNTAGFALPPMAPLFETLGRCLADNRIPPVSRTALASEPATAPAAPAPAPIPAEASAPAPSPVRAPTPVRDGFSPDLAALLSRAGIKDATPMDLSAVPEAERPADEVWDMGPLLGGVRTRQAPGEKSLSDLVGLHVQGLREKCAGAFKADLAREQVTPTRRLRTGTISCGPDETQTGETVAVALLFSLTPEGRFTVYTLEGLAAEKQNAQKTRDRLLQALLAP